MKDYTNILNKIVGFRSKNRVHMIISSVWYIIAFIMLILNSVRYNVPLALATFFVMVGLPFIVVGIVTYSKYKNSLSTIIGGTVFVIISIFFSNAVPTAQPAQNSNTPLVAGVETVPTEIPKSRDEVMQDYEESKENLKESLSNLKEAVSDSYYEAAGVEKPTEKPSEFQQMMNEAVAVSWRDVVDAYEENAINADSQYKNKILKMNITVSDIGREILQNPYVTCEKDVTHGIRASFNKDEESKIANLSKGSAITIVGKCTGELITGTVSLLNCYIAY